LRGGVVGNGYASGQGRRLDKRWARDQGGGGGDLPSVTARRISAGGSGGRIRRREQPETGQEGGAGEGRRKTTRCDGPLRAFCDARRICRRSDE
jgi:hypothetical protein